tara:strand:- start:166 stop:837 length:672 start_codon:yes stop_codon:yes gene_type:complete
MDGYIQNSLKDSNQKLLHSSIYVYVLNPLPDGFDLDHVLTTIEEIVPEHLVYGLEAIYIGKFGDLEEKEFDALYKDGTIYATNEQDDEDDLIDDIVHELAHLAEENLGHYIYSDRKIIDEFLGKRERLYSILKAHNYEPPGREAFYDLEYNKKFDYFLYKTIGYQRLTYLSMGLFVSPYSITSLREYFAKSFQRYFMDEMEQVQKISPAVFEKIEFLVYKKYE